MMREVVCGNIYMRQWKNIPLGHVIEYHKHHFDHTTIVIKGSCRVEADGNSRVYKAGEYVLIKADTEHRLTALEDGTEWWCVYSHRAPNGEIVQNIQESHSRAYG